MIRDLSSVPAVPVVLPGPGGRFTDELGGVLIEVEQDASDGYSNIRGFSCDTRHFTIGVRDEPWLYGFDPVTGAAAKLRKLLEGSQITTPVQWDATFWDAVNPNVCYVVEPTKQRIWSVDISKAGAKQFKEIRRFNGVTELPGANIYQHSCSDDGTIWAFHAILLDGTVKACVWNRPGNIFRTYAGPATAKVNECQVSPDGKIVRIFFNDESCVLWDPRTDASEVIPNLINHADWANRIGPGVLFASGDKAGGENAITLRDLGAPDNAVTLWSPKRADGSVNWDLAHHVSIPPGKDWCIVSTYAAGLAFGVPRPWNAFEGEIVQIYFDGSFRRLCHNRSEGYGGTLTTAGHYTKDAAGGNSLGYWCQPRANVSRCGRWVIFTSLVDGRLYVFLLRVPADDAALARDEYEAALQAEVDAARAERDGLAEDLELERKSVETLSDSLSEARNQRDGLASKINKLKADLE